jgi:hypothetical protein
VDLVAPLDGHVCEGQSWVVGKRHQHRLRSARNRRLNAFGSRPAISMEDQNP